MASVMNPPMKISADWLPPFQGANEIARTSAALQIHFGSETATRFDDDWSKSVQNAARVSVYPLALWFASSWWRIRWEPRPSSIKIHHDSQLTDSDWRMSHELAAAGHGFIWPDLTLESDGESILATCRPSPALSSEPVRYLSDFQASVPALSFESETDAFMDLVLCRLDSLGETQLHLLWREILAERNNPEQSNLRRLEARLGYEPDEAPNQILKQLIDVSHSAGQGAADEIAPACAGMNPENRLVEVLNFASQAGIQATLKQDIALPNDCYAPLPWQKAYILSTQLRNSLSLGSHAVTDECLADLLHIPPVSFQHTASSGTSSPVGLAVREGQTGAMKLLFRKRNRPARRFEASRMVADAFGNPADAWLPVTDSATARQKLQRAFAAEFLCPIESLKLFLGNEFSPESMEEAGEHFGISELVIKSQLANHHLIPRDLLDSHFPA